MVKSIVSQALARQEAERKEEPAEKVVAAKSAEDDEIAKIVESLNVSIKIIGCGGGGSNTVNRCSEAGISGAQLCAVNAEEGLEKLRKFCDTTIVIYNDKLLELVPRLPIDAAFKVADEILMQSIKGMTEIITKPGLVNLDYADLMTIMKGGGVAMIGIGESEEERDRIEYAINEALESPLLGEVDLTHARGALVRVVGGGDLTVSEAERAAEIVGQKINPQARIIWGCSVDDALEHTVRVLLVITGVKSKSLLGKEVYTGPVKTSAEVDEVH